jgi:hypothetical protein
MSRLSEERKEVLLRRYGNINEMSGSKGMKPGGPGNRPAGVGGALRKRPGGGPGGPRGAMVGGKPKNVSATVNRLLAYIGRDKIKILFVFVCVLGATLASLAGSYILRPIINNLVYEDRTAEEK